MMYPQAQVNLLHTMKHLNLKEGGTEEDFIKCLGPTYVGSFTLDGADLRSKGLNDCA